MANEFVAKNGLISQNNTTVSGSLTVTQTITGSISGSVSDYVPNTATSSFATTGANTFTGTQTITGSGNQLIIRTGAATAITQQTTDFGSGVGSNIGFGLAAATGNTYGSLTVRNTGGSSSGNLAILSAGGNVGVGKVSPNAILDVNGNTIITGSLTIITGGSIELQVTDTGVKAGNASTDIHSVTGSLNVTGSGTIAGALAIGTSSLGPNENTLTLGARDTGGEGAQLGFNAPGGTYASASYLDLYQNRFRLLRGTNATSTGEVASWNLHNLQMSLPAYTSPSSFPGTVSAILAINTSGEIITAPGWVDYFSTSTIRGFSSYVAGGNNLQYQIVGKTMYVQFDLRSTTNAGSGSATNFTIPNNASAWAGTQVGMCRTQNTTTQNVGMYQIAAGSNQVNFYVSSNNGTLNSWTDAGIRHIQGFAVINIA